MVQAYNIHKSFDSLEVLKGVNFHAKKGSITSIVGASGAGKSTLLQILGTLDHMDSNPQSKLIIHGVDISTLSSKALSTFRNENIGFIFQFHQLLPEFTAIENVCIPAFIKGTPKDEAFKKAQEILDYLGLSHRINHKPQQLSGGEQQRVAVARALINNPAVIFADEPSGNLDSESAQNLHKLFFDLRDQFGQTFVIVTHNNELANMTDEKITMQDGQIKL